MLIWLPERMNVQAANKLLKIIEEPWEKTLFLMVSESPDKLLPTIVSRTQSVNVPGIETEVMIDYLRRQGVSEADAPKMARLSRGSLLEAQRLVPVCRRTNTRPVSIISCN